MMNDEGQNMDLYIPRKWYFYFFYLLSYFVLFLVYSVCLWLEVLNIKYVIKITAQQRTDWSHRKIMLLFRSMWVIWMTGVFTLVVSPLLPSAVSFVLRFSYFPSLVCLHSVTSCYQYLSYRDGLSWLREQIS